MPFPRVCEICNKLFEVPSRTLIGRFCSKVCMDEWQRNSKWESRIGKKRDGYRCVECNKRKKLAVHHIDYNKKNSVNENCISLCFSCHGKTNAIDRNKWTTYFREKYQTKLNIAYAKNN